MQALSLPASHWAPASSIVRKARGSDNWPITWADDDNLYTAYGDGKGFEPLIDVKLSMGLCRIRGAADNFSAVNLRSPSLETLGDGAKGKKASGLLMVDGTLYLLAAQRGQLAVGLVHRSRKHLDLERLEVRPRVSVARRF